MRKSLWMLLACCLGLGGIGLLACRALSTRLNEPGGAGPAVPQAANEPRVAARVDCYGDPLPAHAVARMGTVRQWYGRLDYIPQTVLAFSPDDKTLISQNCQRKDGSVCLWDAATGREIRWIANASTDAFRWPDEKIAISPVRLPFENNLLALSPDGKTLAQGKWGIGGNAVYLWEVATGKLLHKLRKSQESKREAGLRAISFLPNGKILTLDTAGDNDYRIYLWDVAMGGREISQLSGQGKDLNIQEAIIFSENGRSTLIGGQAAFSVDGKMIAAVSHGTKGRKLILWEVATGKKIHQLQLTKKEQVLVGRPLADLSPVCSLAFSPDGKTLASSDGEEGIYVWEIATGKLIHQLRLKMRRMLDSCPLAYSPDGKTLFGGSDGHLWDVATGKEIRSFGWENAKVAVFSHNGKVLAVGDRSGTLHLWEVATGKEILSHKGHQNRVHSIAYSPDSKTLASMTNDGTIRLWEAATGKEIHQLAKHVTQDPNGSRAHFQAGKAVVAVVSLDNNDGSLAYYSPDGKMLVSMDSLIHSMDSVIHLWDTATGKEIRQFQVKGRPLSATFSPDGKILAATAEDGGAVCLWQVATDGQIYSLSSKRSIAGVSLPIVFSPDGRMLAAPGKDGTIDLWEVATGKSIGQLQMKQGVGRICSLAFSPDSRTLAISSDDAGRAGHGKAQLWEVATGKEICQLNGLKDSLWRGSWLLTFSPDSRMLATVDENKVSGDDEIHLWEVATGKHIGQLSGHRSHVQCVVFSPDGKTLASGSDDLTCLVWDVTPFGNRLKPMPALLPDTQPLSKERLDAAWADLAKDPPQAYAAVRALQTMPAQAISLLRERIRPIAPLANPKQLMRWIGDLDDNSFTVRDKAQREIEKLGELAIPALRQALKDQPALELKRRLQDLLAELEPKLVGSPPRRLRERRAVQVLESIGTAEASQVLQTLAKGVPEVSLTRDAEAALARLAKQPAAKK